MKAGSNLRNNLLLLTLLVGVCASCAEGRGGADEPLGRIFCISNLPMRFCVLVGPIASQTPLIGTVGLEKKSCLPVPNSQRHELKSQSSTYRDEVMYVGPIFLQSVPCRGSSTLRLS